MAHQQELEREGKKIVLSKIDSHRRREERNDNILVEERPLVAK